MTRIMCRCGAIEFIAVMHAFPHLDEYFALFLIIMFATPEWFTKYAVRSENGRPVIELGVGNGLLNEHPLTNLIQQRDRAQSDCCSTLTAKSLGIDTDPIILRVLAYVFGQDSAAKGHDRDLARMLVKIGQIYTWHGLADKAEMHAQMTFDALTAVLYGEVLRLTNMPLSDELAIALQPEKNPVMLDTIEALMRLRFHAEPERIARWTKYVELIYDEDQKMFRAAIAELKAHSELMEMKDIFIIAHERGRSVRRPVRICVHRPVHPYNNGATNRAYRSKELATRFGGVPDMIVCLRPTPGDARCQHVFIGANHGVDLPLVEVAAILRMMTIRANVAQRRFKNSDIPHESELRYEGSLPGCEEIYLAKFVRKKGDTNVPSNGTIMNGSITAPDVAPLIRPDLLSEADVLTAVRHGLARKLVAAERVKMNTRRRS